MARKKKRKYTRVHSIEIDKVTPGMEKAADDPLNHQVGGDHYRSMRSQPIQYILMNDLGYVEGRVTEYMARWRKKGGPVDLMKAKHLLEIAIKFHGGVE